MTAESGFLGTNVVPLASGMFERASAQYVHFGRPPENGRSYDSVGDCTYAGVCCYPAILHGNRIRVIAVDLDLEATRNKLDQCRRENRPVYLLLGEVIGFGRDGEPILSLREAVYLADCSAADVELLTE